MDTNISSKSLNETEIVDFEEQITETYVKKPEPGRSTEIRVKTVTKKNEGFSSTTIEKFDIPGAQQNSKPSYSRQPGTSAKKPPLICDTISLAIEDLLDAEKSDDHWKVFETHFRCVLIYGRIIVLNQFSKNDRNFYKFKIDDGTGSIVGVMGVAKNAQRDVEGFKKLLSAKLTKNIPGLSEELLKNIQILNHSTRNEVSKLVTEFRLGPMREKALVLGNLYLKENENSPQLNVIDLSPNDDAELYWKRQLNLLYEREYLKDILN